MNQYERGKHRPDARTIERICKVLKVPVAYMYCEDDELAHIVGGFSKLSRKDKNKVLNIVK